MENAISQGYPMFAAVAERDSAGERRDYVGLVIGWDRTGGGELLAPIVMEIGTEGAYAAVVDGAAGDEPADGDRYLIYIGNDIASARAAVTPAEAPTSTQSAFQGVGAPADGTRYARGATALCSGSFIHNPHLWMPDGHEYLIACPGQPAG